MAEYKKQRESALQRWFSMVIERSSWISNWQELAHFMLPRSGRFDDTSAASAPNRGDKKHTHIYDSTATRSLNILTAGLLSGASSPARPWFRLKTPYTDLNNREPVKRWLFAVEERMREVFNSSNTYRAFRQVYQELSAFGTASNITLQNFNTVLHNHPQTIGEYAIGTDSDGKVDTLYRKFDLNVGQLVGRFGYERCSNRVRTLYDRGNLTPWIPVLHAIEPRRERNPLKLDNRNMPFSSCYYEFGGEEQDYLRESGFRTFPAQCPRWETRGADIYGSSPGMLVLGDTKQLQHQQLRKSQAIDFQTLPPLAAPPSAQSLGLNLTPGAVNYVDVGTSGVKSLFEVNLDLGALREDILDVRGRIERGFFVDLFLLILGDTRATPATATEIAERHEEKLLMLGPVLESLHDEFLGAYIELAFSYLLEANLVPPPPQELEGVPLSIKFVSLLAQAQNLVGLGSVERLIGSVVNTSAVKPDLLDKLDLDRAVEIYADMLGVDPTLIVSGDQVALIRQQRAQQQQVAQAAAMAQQGAAIAKDLGTAGEDGRDAAAEAAAQLGIV